SSGLVSGGGLVGSNGGLVLGSGLYLVAVWQILCQRFASHNPNRVNSVFTELTESNSSESLSREETSKGPTTESFAKKKGRTVVITTEDMQKRRNDVKERTTLLLALPGEHQLRFNKFWKKPGKKITIQGSDVAGFDKSKVECFNCYKMGHFAGECRAPRSQDKGKRESYKQSPKEEEPAPKALMAIDGIGWDWSYMANEEENHALVADDEVPTEFALMAKSSSSSENEVLTNQKSNVSIATKWAILLESAEHLEVKTKDWSYMANEEENHALVADDEVPTEFALMAKSSSSSENEVYDDSYYSKSCRKNTENLNTKISKLNEELSDCETDLYNYKRGLSHVEARLVKFKEHEVKFCERIRGLERDVKIRENKIEYLKNELE
nr:hypothetical protein [Tanacetum cinerariifolium]